MIKEKLKILVVEDDMSDFKLIERQIGKIVEEPYISHVKSFKEFTASVVNFIPDIIISDYKLKGYTGMDVLKYAQKESPATFFIFVTGTIDNEEIAANTILNGASGYILKNNISKLNEKLLPVFQNIIKSRKRVVSPEYKETLYAIQGFIDSAYKTNAIHRKNYETMKASLAKFKKDIK